MYLLNMPFRIWFYACCESFFAQHTGSVASQEFEKSEECWFVAVWKANNDLDLKVLITRQL